MINSIGFQERVTRKKLREQNYIFKKLKGVPGLKDVKLHTKWAC